jgi:hypothetical protein
LYVPVALGKLGVCCWRQDAPLQVGNVSADVVGDTAKMPPVFIAVNVESTLRVGRPDAVHRQVRQVLVDVEDVRFTMGAVTHLGAVAEMVHRADELGGVGACSGLISPAVEAIAGVDGTVGEDGGGDGDVNFSVKLPEGEPSAIACKANLLYWQRRCACWTGLHAPALVSEVQVVPAHRACTGTGALAIHPDAVAEVDDGKGLLWRRWRKLLLWLGRRG